MSTDNAVRSPKQLQSLRVQQREAVLEAFANRIGSVLSGARRGWGDEDMEAAQTFESGDEAPSARMLSERAARVTVLLSESFPARESRPRRRRRAYAAAPQARSALDQSGQLPCHRHQSRAAGAQRARSVWAASMSSAAKPRRRRAARLIIQATPGFDCNLPRAFPPRSGSIERHS